MDERDFEKGSIGLQIVKSLVKEKLYGNLDIKTGNKGTDISFGFENWWFKDKGVLRWQKKY